MGGDPQGDRHPAKNEKTEPRPLTNANQRREAQVVGEKQGKIAQPHKKEMKGK